MTMNASRMEAQTLAHALLRNFLGGSPQWYKVTIATCLVLNPVLFALDPYVAGWALVLEFIFTLAMALRCYPLQPGGLLAIEAVIIGMTTPAAVYEETTGAIEVVLLLVFMVAGIYFLKDLLLFAFTKVLLGVRSKALLSVLFAFLAALLSAFLDALTVIAVVITVVNGFYAVYHRVASGLHAHHDHDASKDDAIHDTHREDLNQFRAFLRSLVMHAAVGTALGGVATMVGEPQNLLIATTAGWGFVEFFVRVAPVSLPVLAVGLATCLLLERLCWFGYGVRLPEPVRAILNDFEQTQRNERTGSKHAILIVQGIVATLLVIALGFHWAQVGLIGLAVIVLATAFSGITEEHRLGHAFQEALPFTALLVVFFAIVAVIHEQHLFGPIIQGVFALPPDMQVPVFFIANGVLSAISDNVFVATVYMSEISAALSANIIDREQFELLAVAINTGTNIPSIATPNGQAAFLFLLTSALAPLIRLSYVRMLVMAVPYTLTMTTTALVAVIYLL
jgi:NhaB family Na+:H+ antiporter